MAPALLTYGPMRWMLGGFLALFGCGVVQEVDGEADAGDCEPAEVVMSSPADGAAHVGILSPPRLGFSAPLDEEAIDGDSLQIYEGESRRRVPAEVVYEPRGRALTAVPEHPLQHGTSYRVELGAVADACGQEVTAPPLRFLTSQNGLLHYASLNGAGVPTDCTLYQLDDQGRALRVMASTGPGPDGDYCTGDDAIGSYREVSRDGAVDRTRHFNGPGDDGDWFTADDSIAQVQVTTWGPVGLDTSIYYQAGDDGDWFTADDLPTYFSAYRYQEETDLLDWTANHDGPGPDGVPLTGDDEVSGTWTYEYQASGYRRVHHGAPGPNGTWFDADDVADQADGWVVAPTHRDTLFYDAGPDGIWGNGDDRVTSGWRAVLDDRGLTTSLDVYSGTGADGEPFTGDDPCTSSIQHEYDDAGNTLTRARVAAGPDDRCHTADDSPADFIEVYDPSK